MAITVRKDDLGVVTAYGYAVQSGYTGTEEEFSALLASYKIGYPLTAATASDMTDQTKVYVYVGSEYGYTFGDWYYFDGEAWTSGGVYNSVAVQTDKGLTQSDEAADAKATGDRITPIESDVANHLMDKYSAVTPSNWYDPSASTAGELDKDGVASASTTRFYTGYIPVSEGDVVRAFRSGNFNAIYHRHVCCYDSGKSVVSSAGNNSSSTGSFTVPSGVSFVRFTLDNIPNNSQGNPSYKVVITRDGTTPTTYTDYFEPYLAISTDFVTPAAESILSALQNNSFTTMNLANRYGCALPTRTLRETIGIQQTWYDINAFTPSGSIHYGAGAEYGTKVNGAYNFKNTSALSSANGFTWSQYDVLMSVIRSYLDYNQYGFARKFVAESLANCSLLMIGDSTIASGTIGSKLMEYFGEKSKTITLIGTLGTGDNKNEGRAGWSAADYFTDRTYNGVVNPFYNPTSETFDFDYYMTQQGFSTPDYVLIQLGINDLYNYGSEAIEPLWSNIKAMVDSIRAYDSGIKVLLDLVTPPNTDQSKHTRNALSYRNRVIQYNDLAIDQVRSYADSAVRYSYVHLVLDPDADISDNVHPTATGYNKMAMEIINQINCWQNGA